MKVIHKNRASNVELLDRVINRYKQKLAGENIETSTIPRLAKHSQLKPHKLGMLIYLETANRKHFKPSESMY